MCLHEASMKDFLKALEQYLHTIKDLDITDSSFLKCYTLQHLPEIKTTVSHDTCNLLLIREANFNSSVLSAERAVFGADDMALYNKNISLTGIVYSTGYS